MNTEIEKLTLHFKYCGLIAVMLIIAISTERWSSTNQFTTYLSNAATMTSLLLGVVAIFYSFISNDSMSRSLGSISTITAEVRDVRNEIGEFVDLTKQATITATNNTELVRNASVTLTSSMETLHETLVSLATQNETLRGLVSSLPTQIDQLDTKVVDFAKAIGEKPLQNQPTVTSTDLSAKAIELFLNRSSLTQNLLAIACVVAVSKGKNLSIPNFATAISWDAPNQQQGFLSCMHAIQLCSRRAVEGQNKVYKIISVHPELQAQSRTYYMNYINSNYPDGSEEKQVWLERLARVEELFN